MSPAWLSQLLETLERNPCVLVTLRQHKGSAPRESGARMVVSEGEVQGSIGGGNLEFQAISTAREMLARTQDRGEAPLPQGHEHYVGATPSSRSSDMPRLEPYGLGPALNQCCGGSVELLFELLSQPIPDWMSALYSAAERGDRSVLLTAVDGGEPRHIVVHSVGRQSVVPEELRPSVLKLLSGESDNPIEVAKAEGCSWWLAPVIASKRRVFLFGAGHVGKAVVRMLADLPFEVEWIDGRKVEFPATVPDNVTVVHADDPLSELSRAPAQTTFVVMTHSHDLDEELCHAILERDDFAFLGLIGSASKRRRFEHRLARRGIGEAALKRLVCPVGMPGIAGKEPATIALSLAAQLMSEDQLK